MSLPDDRDEIVSLATTRGLTVTLMCDGILGAGDVPERFASTIKVLETPTAVQAADPFAAPRALVQVVASCSCRPQTWTSPHLGLVGPQSNQRVRTETAVVTLDQPLNGRRLPNN